MTALVTRHLPLVSGAPDGIKKLRGLILELAMRGKLVAQEVGDQSAYTLLRQIADEKSRLTALWGHRKERPLPKVLDAECPHALPSSWSWVRLPELYIAIPVRGNQLLSSEIAEDGLYPVVDQGKRFVAGYTDNAELLIKLPGPVVVFGDHTTERKFIDFDFVAGADGVKVLRPVCIYERFFWWHLKSLNLEDRGYARHFKVLNSCLFALPPLPEQHRIVAKVDELMALCDRLEADQADAEAAHAQLVQALLDSLTQATDAADFRASWQRLSEHFHTLFTTEASIDALKQTVLQLAVVGKLVKQNPEDEWASELLKRVALERTRLLEEGGSRKHKSSAKLADEDRPFELPLGWEWVRLGDYCLTQTGTTPNKSQHELFGSHVPFIKPGDIYPSWVKYDGEGLSALGVSQNGRIARAGSLLMVCIGTIGKCNLIDRDCSFNQQINSATLYEGLPKYLLIALRSRYFQDQAWSNSSSTTIAILNKGKWESIPIPLPGITEQHRIVAKVDELMTLCDQLKAQLAEARQQHAQLANVLVEQAVAA